MKNYIRKKFDINNIDQNKNIELNENKTTKEERKVQPKKNRRNIILIEI
jgi:hypothetical protein